MKYLNTSLMIALAAGAIASTACVQEETVYVHENGGGDGGVNASGGMGGSSSDGGNAGGNAQGGQGGTAVSCTSGLDAECVACGSEVCDASSSLCCSDGASASCGADCALAWSAACDGGEDCPGAACCVDMHLFQNNPDGATATCGSCTISGSSASVKSQACRAKADCAGLSNQFNVPFSECCFAPGYEVGVCTSQTSAFVDFDDNCNP